MHQTCFSSGAFEDCWGEDDAGGQFLPRCQSITILREICALGPLCATCDRFFGVHDWPGADQKKRAAQQKESCDECNGSHFVLLCLKV